MTATDPYRKRGIRTVINAKGPATRLSGGIMRPEVIAAVSNTTSYANGNLAAASSVRPEVLNDPNIYPPPEVRARLVQDLADSQPTTRLITRLWTRFMTGA